MVEYSIRICYGIIISKEIVNEIDNFLNDDIKDEFYDNYLRKIDSWTDNGEWFLGISHTFCESVINLNSNILNKADLEEIEMKLYEYNLINKIPWIPQKYIIKFCY